MLLPFSHQVSLRFLVFAAQLIDRIPQFGHFVLIGSRFTLHGEDLVVGDVQLGGALLQLVTHLIT